MIRSCKDFGKRSSEALATDTQKKKANATTDLRYPYPGINRNKIGKYDQTELKRVVQHALIEGIDPFMTIGIVMLEKAPIANPVTEGYANRYGRIPVDAIGAYDLLGCASASSRRKANLVSASDLAKIIKARAAHEKVRVQQTTLIKQFEHDAKRVELATSILEKSDEALQELEASVTKDDDRGEKQAEIECFANPKACYGRLGTQAKIPEFDLTGIEALDSPRQSKRLFCTQNQSITVGGHAYFRYMRSDDEKPEAGSCCANVTSHLSTDETEGEFLTAIGAKFVTKNISSCIGKQPIEQCIQKFNGTGCFGCSEKMKNSCYDGIVGGDRPIYGARVVDLMLNTLMTNSEVANLVQVEAKKLGRPVKSAFCAGQAPGRRNVDSATYFDMQKRFLLEGEKGSYKSRFGNDLRASATAEEKTAYSKREAERAKACAVHFKP